MSSKFPSLEEIDDDLTTNTNNDGDFGDFTSNNDDFLAREKAALGEAASEFQTSEDKNVSSSQPDEIDGFNSSFPALESDNNKQSSFGASGLISEPSEPYLPSQPELTSRVNQLSLEDSEAVREWRERQALEIQRRDELSDAKRKETRTKANTAIDDFYKNYSAKTDEAIEKVRADEKAFIEERDNSITGTTWDRIVKLIDTSSKGAKSELHDKTRFKEVLLALKGNPDAPGAAGY